MSPIGMTVLGRPRSVNGYRTRMYCKGKRPGKRVLTVVWVNHATRQCLLAPWPIPSDWTFTPPPGHGS